MKIDKMIPQFTKDKIEVIAQAFSTYRFENNEEGLYYNIWVHMHLMFVYFAYGHTYLHLA